MQETFNIEIDDQKVNYITTPPKSLSENCFQNAITWGVIDPRADLLIQRSKDSSYSVWRFAFIVRQQVKLFFHEPVERMFILFNQGAGIRIQTSKEPPVLYQKEQFNLFYLPEFKITAYPRPNKNIFEILLIEMGNGDSGKMEELLLKAMNNLR